MYGYGTTQPLFMPMEVKNAAPTGLNALLRKPGAIHGMPPPPLPLPKSCAAQRSYSSEWRAVRPGAMQAALHTHPAALPATSCVPTELQLPVRGTVHICPGAHTRMQRSCSAHLEYAERHSSSGPCSPAPPLHPHAAATSKSAGRQQATPLLLSPSHLGPRTPGPAAVAQLLHSYSTAPPPQPQRCYSPAPLHAEATRSACLMTSSTQPTHVSMPGASG